MQLDLGISESVFAGLRNPKIHLVRFCVFDV